MKLITLLFLTFLSIGAFAGVQDSTGVKNVSGKNVIVHVVDKGETLYSLSKRYNVSVKEIEKNNELKKGLKLGQTLLIPYSGKITSPSSEGNTHTVVKGETLYSISKKYKVSVDDIKKWNGLDENSVSIGQALIVGSVVKEQPSSIPEYHIVAKGEGLYSISKKYGVSVDEIKTKNNLSSNELSLGQKLYLPGGVADNQKTIKVNKPTMTQEAKKYASKQFVRVEESGTALVKVSESINSKYSYCYHPTLPAGSVIQITSKETGAYVWARVKSNFEPTNSEIIWVNKTVIERLGIKSNSFSVVLSYVK